MRFGLSLSGLLQHEGGANMAERFTMVLELVRLARELGFDYVYAGHHYLSAPYQTLQPLISLSRIAAETGEMDLLSTILMPLVHPVQLAEDVATLDAVSNGHIIISAALGYRDIEFDSFGVAHGERVARMLECLEVTKALWSGEPVTHEGRFFHLKDARIGVLPIQKPHPRVWMAANGDRMVERIGRMGHPWYLNPHAPFDTLERQVGLYKAAREAAGHGAPDVLPMSRETYVAPTREQAYKVARPFLEGKYNTYAAWGQDKALPGEESFQVPFEELAKGRFIIGSPDDVIADLARFKALGVNHASLRFGWPGTPQRVVEDAIRLAAAEVFPALR
jgi:alkanesulfonate monooxygenase SsuD/methylene tetrahydromethanopterin reductase-like flavin-dependent oxidoreductase (luciferase family)